MGYKNKSSKAASGMAHNPPPRTKRGELRAGRKKECKTLGMPYAAKPYDTEKGSMSPKQKGKGGSGGGKKPKAAPVMAPGVK